MPSPPSWLLAAGVVAGLALAGCGGGGRRSTSPPAPQARSPTPTITTATTGNPPRPKPRPSYPQLLRGALQSASSRFAPVVLWQGRPAARIAHVTGDVTLLAFDQRYVVLRLHSGTVDAGSSGWRLGSQIAGAELTRVIAAFNGGFRLNVGAGGFESFGRVAAPLQDGLGSIVTYADGHTDIGSWHREVPASGGAVVSVRQNLQLLIDHGQAAANTDCRTCWGATLGGVDDPARAALGVTGDGSLVWAAGEHLTVAQLAQALLGAHVVRAVELDINPEWVAGYLYDHQGKAGAPQPVPALAGQQGIPGQFLTPWSRDFFAVEAR